MGIIEVSIVVLIISWILTWDIGGYSSLTGKYYFSGITLIKYHEERHKIQDEHGFIRLYSYAIIVSMLLSIITQDWYFMLPGFIAFISIELDAWLYSIWMMFGGC